MDLTRRGALGTLAVALAGCAGGAGGDGDDDTTTERPTTEQPTTERPTTEQPTTERPTTEQPTTEQPTASVRARSHPDLGTLLVDADGMTLYVFENDPQGEGESACTGGCAEAWPPLTVDSADAVSAADSVTVDLGTFERADGSRQVTANGWPLYYFASDEQPGDAKGQGVNDVWWVLRPDGTVVESDLQTRSHPEHREILTDADGMTLYMFDRDTRGEGTSACSGGCADRWPPLTVDGSVTAHDDVTADVATFDRESGGTQVTANGWPLYYFADDEQPGDAKGQGVNDAWWVLAPDGGPRKEGTGNGGGY